VKRDAGAFVRWVRGVVRLGQRLSLHNHPRGTRFTQRFPVSQGVLQALPGRSQLHRESWGADGHGEWPSTVMLSRANRSGPGHDIATA
jgi:hypothetical protein